MPAFLKVITSLVVYSSKSLATPQKSMSLLLKGLMVMKGASFPGLGSQYGVAWLCRTTISGKRSLGKLHTCRNQKASIACSHHILVLLCE